jgi:hypothetical protein
MFLLAWQFTRPFNIMKTSEYDLTAIGWLVCGVYKLSSLDQSLSAPLQKFQHKLMILSIKESILVKR